MKKKEKQGTISTKYPEQEMYISELTIVWNEIL